jgi:hypothetical protein
LILSGSEIFKIFFEGVTYPIDSTEKFNLKADWPQLSEHFMDALSDILRLRNNQVGTTSLEVWYDVLVKVMNLWTSIYAPSANQTVKIDAEDFYLIVYDKEDPD